jgi:hypothetical protein
MPHRWIMATLLLALGLLAACAPPARMQPYDYPALGFSVSFPAPPSRTDVPATSSQTAEVLIGAESGPRDFAVSIAEVADPSRDLDSLDEDAAARMAKAMGGEASNLTYAATPEGLLGRELVIKRSDKAVAKIRLYVAGGRFYILVAKSALGVDDPAVDDFLTSFHATVKAPTNTATTNAA